MHQGNTKESWKIINQVLNKRSKSTNINNVSTPDGVIVNKQKIADAMNEYFCSVGKDLAEKIYYAPNLLLSGDHNVNPEEKCFRFKTINLRNIRDAIGRIKTSKGFSTANISSYFLKLPIPYIENSLACFFNTSLERSKFPDDWKTARVTPIVEEGDKSDKWNYRPISVLPVISRLCEKLVANQLYQYLDHNSLLGPNQSGLRRLHSTVTCLLRNVDDWYTGLDSGQMLGMVFVDLKRPLIRLIIAFSVINLSCMGFNRGNWFKCYLSNRTQYCSVGGYGSTVGEIEVGVPQGSCPGPLLFLIYINDLPKTIQGKVSMYADDTSLCHMSNDIFKPESAINEDLELLDNWLKGNELSLNFKTERLELSATANLMLSADQL